MNRDIEIKSLHDAEKNYDIEIKFIPVDSKDRNDANVDGVKILYLKAIVFVSMNVIAILLLFIVNNYNIGWYFPFLAFWVSSYFAYNIFFRRS